MLLDARATLRQHHLELDSAEGDFKIDVRPSPYCNWKMWIGRLLAAGLLIPGTPIIALLVLVVRLTSPGPGIYRQCRVGQHGKIFWLYKIRTMVHGAERRTGPAWAQPDDPRITRVGSVLRKLHLDEFPQLFNVLRGDMTLIGPRPERPEFVQVLHRQVPGYLNRLVIRPGISGLAQVNLPPDMDLESVRRKLALDIEYIATASPLLDFRLLCCTASHLLGIPGDVAMRVFRLTRNPDVAQSRYCMSRVRGLRRDQALRQALAIPEEDDSVQISFGTTASSDS